MRFQPQSVRQVEHSVVEGYVLFRGGLLEQSTSRPRGKHQAIVGHIGQASFGLQRREGQRMPVDPDISRIRRDSARDDAQQTGLSGAFYFAQRHTSRRERMSQPPEYDMVAIALAEIVDAYHAGKCTHECGARLDLVPDSSWD